MGLDIAEVIMDIEDAFGIEIPEDAAIEPRVSAIVDYIYDLLSKKENNHCFTSEYFYKLRTAISESCNISKREIRPSSGLYQFFDLKKGRPKYRKFKKHLGPEKFRLPSLQSSAFRFLIYVLVCCFVATISLIETFYTHINITTKVYTAALSVIFFGASYALIAYRIKQNREIANGSHFLFKGCRTVSDVAKAMAPKFSEPLIKQNKVPDRNTVLTLVKDVISETMRIPCDKIADDAHLVDDLGMG